mgnify:CR=1 FL=1
MPATLAFSLKQARRLALAAQGFNGRQPPTVKAAHVNRLIERLGLLQIDSVNAVVRSHYLPAFSRLGHYQAEHLDELAWDRARRRRLFEYWGHEASLIPVAQQPLFRWRMARAERLKRSAACSRAAISSTRIRSPRERERTGLSRKRSASRTDATHSCSDASTTCPLPDCRASSTPARMPSAKYSDPPA